MTDLMAKDLDLAMAYASRSGVPGRHDRGGAPAAHGGQHGRLRAGGLLGRGQGGPGAGRRCDDARRAPLPTPALILAADHRARAVLTTENWAEFFGSLAQALPFCDGILATAQPLPDLAERRSPDRAAPHLSLDQPDRAWPARSSSSTTAWWRASAGPPRTDGRGSST